MLQNIFIYPLVVEPIIFESLGINTILATNLELDREFRVVPYLLHLPFLVP
jgi:hypothetical protein